MNCNFQTILTVLSCDHGIGNNMWSPIQKILLPWAMGTESNQQGFICSTEAFQKHICFLFLDCSEHLFNISIAIKSY